MLTVSTITDEAFGGGNTSAETSDGSGLSLREALGLIADGAAGPINFDNGLSGSTFSLTLGVLSVAADTELDGDLDNDGSADITVSNTTGVGVLSFMTNGVSFTNAGALLFANSVGTGIDDVHTVLIDADNVTFSNEGEVRSRGDEGFSGDRSVGIRVQGDGATINNAAGATIFSEGRFGIETEFTFDVTSPVNLTVNNDGLIEAGDDAIRIAQGVVNNTGSIISNGTYEVASTPGLISDGITAGIGTFLDDFDVPAEGLVTVNNAESGLIEGVRSGIFMSGGGVINNDGAINGGEIGVTSQGLFDGNATSFFVNNTGLIERNGENFEFNSDGFLGAVSTIGGLSAVTIVNSGELRSTDTVVNVFSGANLTNTVDGVLLGDSDNADNDAIAFLGSVLDDFEVSVFVGFSFLGANAPINSTQNVSIDSNGDLVTDVGTFSFQSGQVLLAFVSDADPILPLVDLTATQSAGFVVYETDPITGFTVFASTIDVATSLGTLTVNYDGSGFEVVDSMGDPVYDVPGSVNFDDVILNQGLFVGDVITGLGNDNVTNNGTVQGDFFLGLGDDTINDNDSDSNIDGGDGDDLIFANGGADNISGGAGGDDIRAGNGGDTANGEGGSDVINGGGGNDDLSGAAGNDTIDGGNNNDTIDGGSNDDSLDGRAGGDNINGGGGNDFVGGQNGSDSLSGDNGDDLVRGGAGNDTLDGGSGVDTLEGGDGNDSLTGGDDNDTLDAGKGLDVAEGGNGADSLRGRNGGDDLQGNDGNDTIKGDGGNDTLGGGEGDDELFGNFLDDELNGEAGNDTLTGGKGSDALNGGSDNDRLVGSQGSDTLAGNTGNDTLVGGSGDDVFQFALGDGQ